MLHSDLFPEFGCDGDRSRHSRRAATRAVSSVRRSKPYSCACSHQIAFLSRSCSDFIASFPEVEPEASDPVFSISGHLGNKGFGVGRDI